MARRSRQRGGGRGEDGWRRRAGAGVRYALLGVFPHMAYDHDMDLREPLGMNHGKIGAPFRLGATMAVAVAVSRDLSHSSLRRAAGSLAEASRGACTVTYPRACRRINALDLGDVEWCVRRRGIRTVRDGGERVRVTTNQHGGAGVLSRRNGSRIAMVTCGQCRVAQVASRMARADAPMADAAVLAVRAADAHRGITHGGGIHKRRHRKASFALAILRGGRVGLAAVAPGSENSADAPALVPPGGAAAARGAPGRGTDVIADKACATRRNVAWCAAHGADPVIPVKINSSGKSRGTPRWHRHVVHNLAPPGMRRRLMRGGDVQSLPRSTLVLAQAGRMGRKRHSRRQAVEGAIGAFKQVFRGDLMAQKEENAAAELTRKAIIYNESCR